MLAGYLPFDDDPANPEGDNINLLYKYIVSTPLTFPEYVTPHARDLLRRILVPDPRKRADLFEVARHSWLSEYAHVVGFITSSTTTPGDIGNTTVGAEEQQDAPLLARSASVREPTKTSKNQSSGVGEMGRKHGNVDQEAEEVHSKPQKDAKRRTVQVEYVAPRSQTVRGESSHANSTSARPRTRAGSQGGGGDVSSPVIGTTSRTVSREKPLPRDPPVANQDMQYHSANSQTRRPTSSQRQQGMAPPTRPGREPPRSVSDMGFMAPLVGPPRPNTGGSMGSTVSRSGSMGLPSRGSYGQPVAPTVAGTNVHGRMSQPKNGNNYVISNPIVNDGSPSDFARPGTNDVPPKFAQVSGYADSDQTASSGGKGHKRSNTIGGIGEKIFGRSGSLFGTGKTQNLQMSEKSKKYPPLSMNTSSTLNSDAPRPSIDSRRSSSFGFGKKRSGSVSGDNTKPRRFSLLPASFSLRSIGIGKEYGTPGSAEQQYSQNRRQSTRPDSRGNYLETTQNERGAGQNQSRSTSAGTAPDRGAYGDASFDDRAGTPDRRDTDTASPQLYQQRPMSNSQSMPLASSAQYGGGAGRDFRHGESALATESGSSINVSQPQAQTQNLNGNPSSSRRHSHSQPQMQTQYPYQSSGRQGPYPAGFNESENAVNGGTGAERRTSRGVLHKNARRFADAYEDEDGSRGGHGHAGGAGSSGAARKVMDFFRRRGTERVKR